MLVNTNEFRRPALYFKKHGYYTRAIPGTPPWREFWHREKERCAKGFSVGGQYITGDHYFYLNYYQMLRVSETESITGMKGQVRKIEDFPAFWDGDYNFFWALEIAQHGITPEKYKELNLQVNIKDLTGGQNLVVLKARGKGYSYKMGAVMAKRFNLGKKSKVYAMADLEEYLIKDGLLNKVWDGVDFLDHHTAWAQPRLKDLDMHKRAGYRKRTKGGYKPDGLLNEVIGVTFRNDPNKARGKRGEFIIWEEAGKFPSLKKAWDIAEDSIRQGRFATGCQVAFGTGGSEDADFADLQLLFYEPHTHNVLPFENIWDEGHVKDCSYFVPAYQNLEGFMDEEGNSDEKSAREFIDGIREKKKESGDPKSLDQYVAENPYNPQEATLKSTANMFPVRELQEQLNYVMSHSLHMKMGSHGFIVRDARGTLKFSPSGDAHPITRYPHKRDDDTTGCITIYEPPYRSENGTVPDYMYIACHDPYAHDTSTTGESLGTTYIIKQTNNLSLTFNECIVASYVGRPSTQDEYNVNMFNLCEYYNAKLGFENDRGDVIPFAKRTRRLGILAEEFEMLYKKELSSTNVKRNYGMHMTDRRKEQGEIYLSEWLRSVTNVYEDGRVKKVLHYIYDPALLQELINFFQKGNFDRVMALMIGMYHQKEVFHKEVVAQEEDVYEEFFNRELFV